MVPHDQALDVAERGLFMPKLIAGERLRAAVKEQTFIKGGLETSAEGVKYDFRMGTKVLKATFGQPIDMEKMAEAERRAMAVEPGEIVFVVTEERLELPQHIMAVLSPKRKLSHEGIQVLGGLCVDPLYRGRLWIGLQNVSSTKFPLIPGKKLIAAVFYELEAGEIGEFPTPETQTGDFPDELIRLVQNYRPIALQGIQDALIETQRQLADLKSDISSGREWQREFRESLQAHSTQIEKLLEGLKEEKENRVAAQRDFDKRLQDIQKEMYGQATKLGAIIALIVIIGGAIVQFLLPKIFGP
jgi:deoxycytidine triphosphate deaminase